MENGIIALDPYSKIEMLMVSTVEKGDELENHFHNFLLAQRGAGKLVFDLYAPELCKIYKKKKYYCTQREDYIIFDVVIEIYRPQSINPTQYVVFECKNYKDAIPERDVTDFSDKVDRIFGHAVKAVIVVNSRLQAGAQNLARARNMGIVKYDESGIEIVADRRSGNYVENSFIESQLFSDSKFVKSLRFSAYYDGNYFGSIHDFLRRLDRFELDHSAQDDEHVNKSAPYISNDEIQARAFSTLSQIQYREGPVNLINICEILEIKLDFFEEERRDAKNNIILGTANFDRRSISINSHDNGNRERFTLAHEIGHFCLDHDNFLRSEYMLENDLIMDSDDEFSFNYDRLEIQANMFASHLLLPKETFRRMVEKIRFDLDIRDRGHGYIYVDDQPSNLDSYYQLLGRLSTYFEVSKRAIEIKLKKEHMLNDRR